MSSTAGRRSFSNPSSTFPIGNSCSSFIGTGVRSQVSGFDWVLELRPDTWDLKPDTSVSARMRFNRSAGPAVLLQLVIESDPVDVEHFRGVTLIASTFLQHPQDVGTFHVLQLLAGAARTSHALRLEDEVLFTQLRFLSDDHGPLHGVLQFTNVPQPGLLL